LRRRPSAALPEAPHRRAWIDRKLGDRFDKRAGRPGRDAEPKQEKELPSYEIAPWPARRIGIRCLVETSRTTAKMELARAASFRRIRIGGAWA
jgi:hypothetical protein